MKAILFSLALLSVLPGCWCGSCDEKPKCKTEKSCKKPCETKSDNKKNSKRMDDMEDGKMKKMKNEK